jgi:hypothetical protein
MEAIKVIDKKSEKAFFQVPRKIYADDPNWIPHLKQDIQKIFDPSKNKLFNGGQAARWVFFHNNALVGRVAAFVFPEKEDADEQPTGGMGFFECVDDQDLPKILRL